jgi:hypothetical protein
MRDKLPFRASETGLRVTKNKDDDDTISPDEYEVGYRDGEANAFADWSLALDGLLPDGFLPIPISVAHYIESLQERLGSQ